MQRKYEDLTRSFPVHVVDQYLSLGNKRPTRFIHQEIENHLLEGAKPNPKVRTLAQRAAMSQRQSKEPDILGQIELLPAVVWGVKPVSKIRRQQALKL